MLADVSVADLEVDLHLLLPARWCVPVHAEVGGHLAGLDLCPLPRERQALAEGEALHVVLSLRDEMMCHALKCASSDAVAQDFPRKMLHLIWTGCIV
jgi:hypothetical protein